jgi:hypothetical protein
MVSSDGSSLSAAAIASSPDVQTSIAANIGKTIGVDPTMVRVVNITDIATGVVFRVPDRRRRLPAAGSLGVAFDVVVNLGKSSTAEQLAAKQQLIVKDLNSSAPAFASIKTAVASAAGVSAAALSPVAPTASSIKIAGGVGSIAAAAPSSGGASSTEGGTAAGVVIAVVVLGAALFTMRSKIVSGKFPWEAAQAEPDHKDAFASAAPPLTTASPLRPSNPALQLRMPSESGGAKAAHERGTFAPTSSV